MWVSVFTYAVQNQLVSVNSCMSWKSLPEPNVDQEYLAKARLIDVIKFKLPNQKSWEIRKQNQRIWMAKERWGKNPKS